MKKRKENGHWIESVKKKERKKKKEEEEEEKRKKKKNKPLGEFVKKKGEKK